MRTLFLAATILVCATSAVAAPFEHYDAAPSEWDCPDGYVAIHRDNRAYEVTVSGIGLSFTEVKVTVTARGRIALNGKRCKKMPQKEQR
jgi:hypothetical protein